MTLAPTAMGATLTARTRWYWLKFHRRLGRFQSTRVYHGLSLLGWLATTLLVLAGAQLVVNHVLHGLPIWGWLDVGKPELHILSVTGVLVAYALVIGGRWLFRARTRVVVDDFVDFTADDAKAVSGLATLLATELSRLRSLYTNINETLAVPVAVGVHSAAAPGRDAEPGSFLTVRADDLSDMLQGAVASEAKLNVGPVGIPIGNIAAIFGRLARGPRVLGSVHRTESGGGPTLTAQIIGARQKNTWRVERSHLAALTPAEDKAFLDEMVRELAIEMFTDLTMQGAVRWRAIRTFTEYLRDYRRSMRTPKTRSRFLKQAEEKLLEAIAEDEQFDFAYYNLGVIYSQLALAELKTARQWDVTPEEKADPTAIHGSRMQAATIAFTRAIERNRNRWEAYYALAVHHMTRIKRKYEEGKDELKADEIAALRDVVRLCDRVIATQPRNAEAYDLKGMAIWYLTKVGADNNIDGAIASHRCAVRLAWRNLCREERRAAAAPPTSETALPKREENATAALHNLAMAYGLKAQRQRGNRILNFRRADTLLKLAIELAPPGSAAHLHSQRARLLRKRAAPRSWGNPPGPWELRKLWRLSRQHRKVRQARTAYCAAAAREPEHPLYMAQLARAHAEAIRDVTEAEQEVERVCKSALESLAPVWRRALSDTASRADQRLTHWTFKALTGAYDTLARYPTEAGDEERMRARADRLRAMDKLGLEIKPMLATADGRLKARELFKAALELENDAPEPARGIWEAEQIGVALARAYARVEEPDKARKEQNLRAAATVIDELMARANEVRKDAIQAHELEIRKADVLRQLGGANVADALKLVSKGLMRDPLSERGRAELAEIHMKLWQYDEALNAWEHTLWLKPNDPYVHFKLGMCHWWRAQGSGSRAEAAASRAEAAEFMDLSHHLFSREDVTGKSWLRLWRGRVALERGLRDDAIMHLRAARSYPGGAPVARTFLGEAYLDGEQFTLAAEEFREALRVTEALAPGDLVDERWGDSVTASHLRARCHCGTAAAYVEAGHPADGLAAAERAISAAAGIDAPEERAKATALGLITKARAVMAGAGDE
ncbi:MAG: hypothetical protein QOJ12_1059, partial [Thermoleophilales bacterium]|nr:hypothetical protein [Thermoleophilales bacterium]